MNFFKHLSTCQLLEEERYLRESIENSRKALSAHREALRKVRKALKKKRKLEGRC